MQKTENLLQVSPQTTTATAPPALQQLQVTESELIAALFDQGIKLHQMGRLADADHIYNQILAVRPEHFDSLHLSGVILYQRGQHAEAVNRIDLALKHDPDHTLALNTRGLALKELGRLDDALASFDRALAVKPDYAEALVNRGNALKALQRREEALESYAMALRAEPSSVPAHANRATVLHELGRFADALTACDDALAAHSDIAEMHGIRGNALFALRRYQEALVSYDMALALRPDMADAHYNRGSALHELRQLAQAVASYDRALALHPHFAEAHYNRGNALHLLQNFDAALASFDRALAVQPHHAEAANNRGATLSEMRRYDEALAGYARAVALQPNFADAHYNEALCRLLLGDYERGWPKHEWRWETALLRKAKRGFSQPLWLGTDRIEGKAVLLHAEQGLGDTLQFCRYAPLVSQRGAHAILEVQKPLLGLIKTLPGDVEVISRGEPLPEFDFHCPLLSLPFAFATRLETIPSPIPYLSANAEKVRNWQARLGERTLPRVGLVWAGNPRKELPGANHIDSQRSMGFAQLAPLLRVNGCQFYSLQKGEDAVRQLRDSPWSDRVIDLTDDLDDFSDTAALIETLDLVISVDTSVLHLTGAMGKPVWLLNRYNTCWRWLLERDDSPWYPTLRQFRQDERCSWEPVIARVADALRGYTHSVE